MEQEGKARSLETRSGTGQIHDQVDRATRFGTPQVDVLYPHHKELEDGWLGWTIPARTRREAATNSPLQDHSVASKANIPSFP